MTAGRGDSALERQARVLLLAATDAVVEPLSIGLDALGWRSITARSSAAAAAALADGQIEAVVIDTQGAPADLAAATLRAAAAPRRIAVVGVGDGAIEGLDSRMADPVHPAQLALRLEQLIRAAVAEEEFDLRKQTFADHGEADLVIEESATPPRILVAGQADRRFLALSNALSERGAETVAAPTPYTAFDFLHESAFDAAVLWGGADHAPALSIAAGMKRNTRLYHIPLVLYLRQQGEINLGEIYNKGMADVASADTAEDETADRIMALARTYRRHQAIRRALESVRGSSLTDAATGLVTREVFAAHLARVAEGARARRRALSACILRVAPTQSVNQARQDGWLDRAMPQIGSMLSRLVRAEDTAARLAPEVFALALPATPGPAARLAAQRIAAVIGCTAFDAGQDKPPFVVEFEIGCADLLPGEDPADLLERASRALGR